MKVFVALSVLVVCVAARPTLFAHHLYGHPAIAYNAYSAIPTTYAVTPVEISNQYHAQDNFGQYSYGYASSNSAKAESRSIDGTTSGGYSYVDGEGKVQNVQYTADAVNGFRVAASNLPVAPVAPEAPEVEAPKPVEDTPEVAEARAAHLAAVEEAKVRNAAAGDEETVEINSVEGTPAAVAVAPLTVPAVRVAYPAAPLVGVRYASPLSSFAYSYNTVQAAAPIHAVHPYYSYGFPTHHLTYHGVAPVAVHGVAPIVAAPVAAAEGVDDTVEVAAARAAHAAAHVEAKALLAAAGGEVN